MSELGRWLYAITRVGITIPDGLHGVAGGQVDAVDSGDLRAVTSPVDMDEFGPDKLKQHLEDLDWVSEAAGAHHAVVAAIDGPVVPMRLATVCSTVDGVRDVVQAHRDDVHVALDRLDGRTEWGVKAVAAPVSVKPSTVDSTAGEGKAYLLRRKAERAAREDAERVAEHQAEAIHRELSPLAVATRLHPPQDSSLSGTSDRMVLNGAYLVDDDNADEFGRRVAEADRRHEALRVELTGPWPPYSFAGGAAESAGQAS